MAKRKEIRIPRSRLTRGLGGVATQVNVLLDWPELGHLTDAQMVANALALANGQRNPHQNPQLVSILILEGE